MPRKKRYRKVVAPPAFKGYKPYGVNKQKREIVELLYEEYEAIKLADFDFMNHAEAAELMGVSRPTFARIYEIARQKIARAMVEAKEIKAVFGNAMFDKDWFVCNDCYAKFTIPATIKKPDCPMCSSDKIESLKNYK